ncbi:MAG: Gfo/Idh/MocA family oxidoreductase [Candidatus Choladocola sp.]|nr:Gfo/Idh/MocA family oxidoreductase [Candidatus Choladocola sp.]
MLRTGIVGTNFVSGWMAEALEQTEGITAAAVFSRKQETGAAFAEKYGIPLVFTDFDEFIHSDEIDAVYIASPNFAHCQQAVAAMDAGKHVLCEKIIATNMSEFQQMKEAAIRNKVVLLEAMRPVHDPACQILLDQMPEIGPIRRATIEYCQYSSRYDKFKDGIILNAFNPEFSNAAIMDIGVYCVHFCVRLFGMPEKIHAESSFLRNGMEGCGILLMNYGSMQVEIVYSKITESAFPSIIQGENGTLTVDKLSTPKKLTRIGRDGTTELLPYSPAENNMVYELAVFRDLAAEGKWNHEYLAFSEMTMKIIDEARHQTGIVFPADRTR